MGEILVLVEHREGELRDITYEMLTLANRVGGENGLGVTALILSKDASAFADRIRGGCDRIVAINDDELADYSADYYLTALGGIIGERRPQLVIIGQTAAGMDLAPAMAMRSGMPLVTDCLDVTLKDGELEAVRQIYGGKINAYQTMKPAEQYMITLRPGCFPGEADQDKSAEVETLPAPAWTDLGGRKFLNYLEAVLEDVDITSADVLVSIGRGIGKPENISLVEAFADAIGATLSCSRPVADKEWLPKSRQVGTSGKTVKPKVYIALGISGAFQHQAGMKNSDTIIAVNTDPKAPIFNVAHYGIVGDLLQVVPVLADKLKKA